MLHIAYSCVHLAKLWYTELSQSYSQAKARVTSLHHTRARVLTAEFGLSPQNTVPHTKPPGTPRLQTSVTPQSRTPEPETRRGPD